MIHPRISIQIGWAGALPDVKPPLSQILNTIMLYQPCALVLERRQPVCWEDWFWEAAGIRSKGGNRLPELLQNRNTLILFTRAPLCPPSQAVFHHHLRSHIIVLTSPSVGDPPQGQQHSAVCSIFTTTLSTGYFFAHLPSPQVSTCSTSFHLQITNTSTQAFCSHAWGLYISKGWCFFPPSASEFFCISDLSTLSYTSETWPCTMMLSFTSSVCFHHCLHIFIVLFIIPHMVLQPRNVWIKQHTWKSTMKLRHIILSCPY